MNYLLDTSAFSALMRRDPRMRAWLVALIPSDQAAICTITRGEVLYGLARLPAGKRRRDLEAEAGRLFVQLPCLSLPEAVGDQYALVKRESERQGTPLDENDLWIAATALSVGAVLVTTDTDFERVSGLRIENWTR